MFLTVFYSCETDIDFKGEETKSKMVLNTIINCTSDTAKLELVESIFLFSNKKQSLVEDAEIHISNNSNPLRIWYDNKDNKKAYYKYITPLEVGDKIEKNGYSLVFGKFFGSDIVLQSTEIISVNTQ